MVISFIISIALLTFINSTQGDALPNEAVLNSKLAVQNPYDYVCIVDAGSTGSRIHVYRYTKSSASKLISVDIASEQYHKFKPGLSSFEDHPTDITAMGEYLEPILNFGRDNVPLSKRTNTPLFVLASAGMRKVRDRNLNSNTAQQILDIVYKYLSESSEFIILRQGVKIIEGMNEGLWGWIAANYLNGELAKLLQLNKDSLYAKQTTKGVLEMGGESLQITFIPQEPQLISLNRYKPQSTQYIDSVTIGDVEFELFTYSWMGIGMEAAQNRYDTYLATKLKQRKSSPCYNKGDTRQRQHGIGQSITWKGIGSFKKCYNGLSDMIDDKLKSKCVVSTEMKDMICTPNSVLMPKIDVGSSMNEFYYIENFYYTAKVLGLEGIHGKEFLDKLEEIGAHYCSLEVSVAKREFPEASDDEIKKTCFCASWLLAILKKGFNLEDFTRFRVIRNIETGDVEGEGAIDWALGYLVAEVPNMNLNDMDEQTFAFRFLLIMMVILTLIYCWYKGIKDNQDLNSWIYSKISGIFTEGDKKENNNKYTYQRLNVRRTV